MVSEIKLQWSLFSLRLGVFAVMAMWSVDKILNPEHAASVFERYYQVSDLNADISLSLGATQLIIVVLFLFGARKNFTYGFVLLMHLVSTVSTYDKLMTPWESPNLLFFASLPMLAACYTLFMLREHDVILTIKRPEKKMFI